MPERRTEWILLTLFAIWASVGVCLAAWGVQLSASWAWADALFMVLGSANLWAAAVRSDGVRAAGRSLAVVTLGSAVVETVGATTGWPFGSYYYTEALGWRVGGVLPWTIPLAWWCVLASGRGMAQQCCGWDMLPLAAAVATWATAVDWLMEPFAWQRKGYWIWTEGTVPWNNYFAWFITAFALSLTSRWERQDRLPPDVRPWLVGGFLLLTFAFGR